MDSCAHRQQHKDQATRLRELACGVRRTADTLAVISGKGGVGKTNVAVNLSICLASKGRRVALVDLDLGLANADLLMGLAPRYTIAHMLSGARTIEEVIVEGPQGLRFVPGASGLDQLANLSEFERQNLLHQFQALEDSTEMLVLDCGAGISRTVMKFAQAARRVMVVTTPEPTAVTDAYAAIKTLAREHYRGVVGVLVNKAGAAEAAATSNRIRDVARKFLNFPIANFGHIAQDMSVVLAVRARSPVVLRYPHSKASACFAAVADTLAARSGTAEVRNSFFRRVAGLFF